MRLQVVPGCVFKSYVRPAEFAAALGAARLAVAVHDAPVPCTRQQPVRFQVNGGQAVNIRFRLVPRTHDAPPRGHSATVDELAESDKK